MTDADRIIEAIALMYEGGGYIQESRPQQAARIRALKIGETFPEEPTVVMEPKKVGTLTMTMNQKETKIVEPDHHPWAWWEEVSHDPSVTWYSEETKMLADWKADREEELKHRLEYRAALDIAEAELARLRKIAHELADLWPLGPEWRHKKHAGIDGKEVT